MRPFSVLAVQHLRPTYCVEKLDIGTTKSISQVLINFLCDRKSVLNMKSLSYKKTLQKSFYHQNQMTLGLELLIHWSIWLLYHHEGENQRIDH